MEAERERGRAGGARGERRPPSNARGYDAEWQRIRRETFALWHIPWPIARTMHVHHFPRYVPGTDHRAYRLTPVPGPLHSSHTMKETRAGRPAEWRRTVPKPGELFAEVDVEQPRRFRIEDLDP